MPKFVDALIHELQERGPQRDAISFSLDDFVKISGCSEREELLVSVKNGRYWSRKKVVKELNEAGWRPHIRGNDHEIVVEFRRIRVVMTDEDIMKEFTKKLQNLPHRQSVVLLEHDDIYNILEIDEIDEENLPEVLDGDYWKKPNIENALAKEGWKTLYAEGEDIDIVVVLCRIGSDDAEHQPLTESGPSDIAKAIREILPSISAVGAVTEVTASTELSDGTKLVFKMELNNDSFKKQQGAPLISPDQPISAIQSSQSEKVIEFDDREQLHWDIPNEWFEGIEEYCKRSLVK